jgi:hypothetical protein
MSQENVDAWKRPNVASPAATKPKNRRKCSGSSHGRGGFRTCDLSRVKRDG